MSGKMDDDCNEKTFMQSEKESIAQMYTSSPSIENLAERINKDETIIYDTAKAASESSFEEHYSPNHEDFDQESNKYSNEDKVMKMLFDIENEINESKLLREQKITTLDFSQKISKKRKPEDFRNPLEKIQKIKIENLITQNENYKNLYINISAELKTLKDSMKEYVDQIDTKTYKCKVFKEEIQNKEKTIRSLECQLNKQKNQFEIEKAQLKHEFTQSRKGVEEPSVLRFQSSFSNENLKKECDLLKHEKTHLKDKINKLKETLKTNGEIAEKSKKYKEDCKALHEQIADLTTAQSMDDSKQNLTSEKYNYSMDNLSSLDRDLSELTNSHLVLETANESLDSELASRKNEFENEFEENKKLKNQLGKIIEENKALKEAVSTKETKKINKEFEIKLEKIKNEINYLKQVKEIGEQSHKNLTNQLNQRQEICQELKNTIFEYENELRESRDDNNKLHGKVTKLQKSLKEAEMMKLEFIQQQKEKFENEIIQKKNNLINKNNYLFDYIKEDSDYKMGELHSRLDECESMIRQIQTTTETSLKEALNSSLIIQNQLVSIGRKTNELKSAENFLLEDRMNKCELLYEFNKQRKMNINENSGFQKRRKNQVDLTKENDYLNHIYAIEERSIRLRELIDDIKNNII